MHFPHASSIPGLRWAAAATVTGSLVAVSAVSVVSATSAASAGASGTGTATDPWLPSKTAHISCQSAGRYQNYSDGSRDLRDRVTASDAGTLPAGAAVDVRYETGDRYAVMAKYSDSTTKWAFILRDCVQFG